MNEEIISPGWYGGERGRDSGASWRNKRVDSGTGSGEMVIWPAEDRGLRGIVGGGFHPRGFHFHAEVHFPHSRRRGPATPLDREPAPRSRPDRRGARRGWMPHRRKRRRSVIGKFRNGWCGSGSGSVNLRGKIRFGDGAKYGYCPLTLLINHNSSEERELPIQRTPENREPSPRRSWMTVMS